MYHCVIAQKLLVVAQSIAKYRNGTLSSCLPVYMPKAISILHLEFYILHFPSEPQRCSANLCVIAHKLLVVAQSTAKQRQVPQRHFRVLHSTFPNSSLITHNSTAPDSLYLSTIGSLSIHSASTIG